MIPMRMLHAVREWELFSEPQPFETLPEIPADYDGIVLGKVQIDLNTGEIIQEQPPTLPEQV